MEAGESSRKLSEARTTTDWYIAPTALLALLGYMAFDVATHLTKETVEETGRRVAAISIAFAIAAYFLSILYGQASDVYPSFGGLPLAAVWFLSLGLALFGAWVLYFGFESHSRHALNFGVDLLLECAKMLDRLIKPLSAAVTAGQASTSELSGRIARLDEGLVGLVSAVEAQGKAADERTQASVEISAQSDYRESEFKKAMAQYRKWYEERNDVAKEIAELIKGAEHVLERFAFFSDQLDEYLDFLGAGEHGPRDGPIQGVDASGQKVDQGARDSPVEIQSQTPPTSGKLTTEAGRANRDKGNRAQLEFAETILRPAGKKHEYSLKEGQPDFIFYGPTDNVVKAIGAFKALTLSEAGTRQRWIPRRKMLAELRAATKYGAPLVLFMLNFANGRIWAKVLGAEELKEFDGITTPLMLIENDPISEKSCRETIEMALRLL